jgi:hypothetical protein
MSGAGGSWLGIVKRSGELPDARSIAISRNPALLAINPALGRFGRRDLRQCTPIFGQLAETVANALFIGRLCFLFAFRCLFEIFLRFRRHEILPSMSEELNISAGISDIKSNE